MQVRNSHCSGRPLSCCEGAFLAVLLLQEVRWRGQHVSSQGNRGHPTALLGLLVPGSERKERLSGPRHSHGLALDVSPLSTMQQFPRDLSALVRPSDTAPSPWLPTSSPRHLSDTERQIMNTFGIDRLPKQCPLCVKSPDPGKVHGGDSSTAAAE